MATENNVLHYLSEESKQELFKTIRNISLVMADIERLSKGKSQEISDSFQNLDLSFEMFMEHAKKYFTLV